VTRRAVVIQITFGQRRRDLFGDERIGTIDGHLEA
jgi:hypothetical protein